MSFWDSFMSDKKEEEFKSSGPSGPSGPSGFSVDFGPEEMATVFLKNRVGAESSNGEIYVANVVLKKSATTMFDVAVKLIPTDKDGVAPAAQEYDIGRELGEVDVGPKMHYFAALGDTDGVFRALKGKTGLRRKGTAVMILIVMDLLKGLTYSQFLKKLGTEAHQRAEKLKKYKRRGLVRNRKKKTGWISRITKKSAPTAADEIQKILRPLEQEICAKIDQMHRMNYIHNDLHSNNVFISYNTDKPIRESTPKPYIIDYGLSQYIDPDPDKHKEYKKEGNYLDFLTPRMYKRFYGPHLKNYLLSGKKWKDKKQYCVKASWPCERGRQGQRQFRECRGDDASTTLEVVGSTSAGNVGEPVFLTEADMKEEEEMFEKEMAAFDMLELDSDLKRELEELESLER